MKNLQDKKVLITGGASGIGRATAVALAKKGADVFLLDINEQGLAGTRELVQEHKRRCEIHSCDLTNPMEITNAVQTVLKIWGHIDILINNAGIVYYGPTERMTASQWQRLLQINLHAPIQLTHELLPVLLEREQAHIVNVCSLAGLVAGRKLTAYHTSKFAMVGFSEALRAEFVPKGIGVSAICPGFVTTNLFQNGETHQNTDGVKLPPRWICVTSETVARKIVGAIQRNRRMVVISWMAHMLWTWKRLFPGFLGFLSTLGKRKKKSPSPTLPMKQEPSDELSKSA